MQFGEGYEAHSRWALVVSVPTHNRKSDSGSSWCKFSIATVCVCVCARVCACVCVHEFRPIEGNDGRLSLTFWKVSKKYLTCISH